MDIKALIAQKIAQKMAQVREELKRECLQQAEKVFEEEYEAQVKTKPRLRTEVQPNPKKRRTRITKGFTKPEELVKPVMTLLSDGRVTSKANIFADILQMHDRGVFHLKLTDLEKHSDGKLRVYKSLDRTRRILLATNRIGISGNGCWYKKD